MTARRGSEHMDGGASTTNSTEAWARAAQNSARAGIKRKKSAILVAGMHRSGTSALTRTLNLLGCALPKTPSGDPEHWESKAIMDLNDEILTSAGSAWHDWEAFNPGWYASPIIDEFRERAQATLESEFGATRLFVLKDPRICRLLKFWAEAAEAFGAIPLIVSPIRNPLEVAASLEARNGMDPSTAQLLWLRHVLDAEAASRDLSRAYLRYDDLLNDWHSVAGRLCEALAISWPRHSSATETEIDEYISAPQRHHVWEDAKVLSNPRLSSWIRSTYEVFNRWAHCEIHETDTAKLDQIRSAFDEATPAFSRAVAMGEQAARRSRALATQLQAQEARAGDLDAELVKRNAEAQKMATELQVQAARAGDLDAELVKRNAEAQKMATELQVQAARAGDLEAKLATRDAEVQAQERDILALKTSASWRMTKPLRAVFHGLGWLLRNSRQSDFAIEHWQAVLESQGERAPATTFLQLTRAHRSQGNFVKAERIAQQGLAKHPDNISLVHEHAKIAMVRKDWPVAINRWQAVLESQGDNAPAETFVQLTRAHRSQGNFEKAERTAQQGLAKHFDNISLVLEHAKIAMVRRDWPVAIDRWQAVLESQGDNAPAATFAQLARAHRRQDNLEKAEKTAQHGLVKHPDDIGLVHEHAMIAMVRKDWPEAINRWQAALESQGDNAPAATFAHLSRAQRSQDNLEKAEKTTQHGLVKHPDDIGLVHEHAMIAMVRKDWPEAINRWQAALESQGDNAPAATFAHLSRAHRRQGNFETAEEAVLRGLARYPDHTGLASAHADVAMARRDWPEAISRCQAALESQGDNAPAATFAQLSSAHRMQGNFEKAEEAVREGLARYPDHAGLASEHADVAMARRDWPEALDRCQAALESQGDNAPAATFVQLSRAHRSQGNIGEAEDIVLQGLARFPDSTGLASERAEIAMARRDWPDAIKRWQAVLDVLGRNVATASSAKLNISVARRLSDMDAYQFRIAEHTKARTTKISQPNGHAKIVLYTAISGGYDPIMLPEKLDHRFDYVLFTDTPVSDNGVYQVRPITYFHEDAARSSRFVKTHPHKLLEDYDIAIWIDSNIMILEDIYPLVRSFLASGKAVAAVPHPDRESIYEELEACILRRKDDPKSMREQIARYRQAGFDHGDLIESNLMMFDLRNEGINRFLDSWWTEIDRYSKRDQLSVNYALKQAGVNWHGLTERPDSMRNHPSFALVPHDSGDGPASKLINAFQVPLVDPYAGPSYTDVRDERIAAQMHRKIDIVVCVHNALEDVQLCLEFVRRMRKNEHQKLIIIDDGSDQPTASYLRDFASDASWIELRRNEHASGYTKAANQGLAASSGDLVILLNSDTVVTDGWAEKMADAVFSTPGAGIVGPMSSAASHQSIPEHRSSKGQTAINDLPPGLTAEDMNRYCEQWTSAHVLPRVPLVHGFCLGLTREVISRIGFFDEDNFPRGYGEENDYCFRTTDCGFGLVIATHTYIFHAKSKSYAGPERVALNKASSETFKRLHGRYRIERAVRSMQENPIFKDLRQRAQGLVEIGDRPRGR